MLNKFVDIIKSHEQDYVEYIEYGTYDNTKDYSELTKAVSYLGRVHPSPLLLEFQKQYNGKEIDIPGAILHVLGFLDNLILNKVIDIQIFKNLTEKEIYVYTTKRLLFNKIVLVKCSKKDILLSLLTRIQNDDVELTRLIKYFNIPHKD